MGDSLNFARRSALCRRPFHRSIALQSTIILRQTHGPEIAFNGINLVHKSITVRCSQYEISAYLSRKPNPGFYYVMKEAKQCKTYIYVHFFQSLEPLYAHMKMNFCSLEVAAEILGIENSPCNPKTCLYRG
jgi:hypothetical protein